jgi:hypothetical protein
MQAKRRAKSNLLAWSTVLLCGLAAQPAAAFAQTGPRPTVEAQPEYLPDDPGERDAQARSLFEQGRTAYDEGRYRDAWGYFHESYKASKRPELLYNIGQTADRLRMDADALKAFKMYLERLPDAANRRDVENRVRALEERVKASGAVPAPPDDGSELTPAPAPSETKLDDAPGPPKGGQPGRHGWYFRGALGLGLRRDGVSDAGLSASLAGAGASGELAAGITVKPGLALGGGLFFDWTSKPTLKAPGQGDLDLDSANLTMLGAMGDWYVHPETDGLHLQGALTLAVLSIARGAGVAQGVPVGAKTGSGVGLLLGAGYEWPVQDNWAIGVLGRLTFAGLSEDTRTHGFFALSVLGTATWY